MKVGQVLPELNAKLPGDPDRLLKHRSAVVTQVVKKIWHLHAAVEA